MAEPAPMWIAFPDLAANDVHSQGAVEAYIVLEWLPFWQALNEDAKADYLDRHRASDDWREAIAELYEWEGFDEDGDPIPRKPGWAKRRDHS